MEGKMELDQEYLVLRFEGNSKRLQSEVKENSKQSGDAKEDPVLVDELNSDSVEIAQMISSEIKKKLHADTRVETEIRFRKRSIFWDGVLYVKAPTYEVGETFELARFLEKGVEIVINRVLASRLPYAYKNNISTEVSVEKKRDIVSPKRYSSYNLFYYIILTVLLLLTVINTAMLFALIFSRFNNCT